MKRLNIKLEERCIHLGKKIIEEILHHAKALENQEMDLDIIKPIQATIYLDENTCFVPCKACYDNPMADVLDLKKGALKKLRKLFQPIIMDSLSYKCRIEDQVLWILSGFLS